MDPSVRVSGNRGIAERAKSMIRRLRVPMKDYFLGKMKFSAHDLRVFTPGDTVFCVTTLTSEDPHYSLAPYPWSRQLLPEPIHVLNASKTSPAILECHLLVDWSRQSGAFQQLGDPGPAWTPGFRWSRSFLPAEPETAHSEHRLPVLDKGQVMTICMGSQPFVHYRELEDWADRTGGRLSHGLVVLHVPDAIAEQARTALDHCTEHADIQFIVRLDNEELLPFEWDATTARFIPGFDTIGIEYRG